MTRDEWYALSNEFIHEGHDRALLYFYPLAPPGGPGGTAGSGRRFRPPARVRIEAWCRAAMDAHLRRMVDAAQPPGPIIAHLRLPYVADLGPSGGEVIVWEGDEGLRAMTLLMHRGEWAWYAVPRALVCRRSPVPSSIG